MAQFVQFSHKMAVQCVRERSVSMKKIYKKITVIFIISLLCVVMVGCRRNPGVAGECDTPDCENIQVIHRNRVQDYCFNCRDPR